VFVKDRQLNLKNVWSETIKPIEKSFIKRALGVKTNPGQKLECSAHCKKD